MFDSLEVKDAGAAGESGRPLPLCRLPRWPDDAEEKQPASEGGRYKGEVKQEKSKAEALHYTRNGLGYF
jgi:hypothetical protein